MPKVKTNGIQMYYEEVGSGEPLILIMGLGADHTKWEDHVAEYSRHFRCMLLDNRGAGMTDKPEGPYSTDIMADDTAGLMDALGIDHARVAGISMGSAIAQNLALKYPEKVRSMVLVSSWARCNAYLKSLLSSFKKMRTVSQPGDFMELLQLWIFTSEYFDANIDDMRQGQLDAENDEDSMPQYAFEAQCDACSSHFTIDRLGEISAPALITVGVKDIFTPPELSLEIHERMPSSELFQFPQWGHCHHWEDLDMYNSRTVQFLKNH